MKIWVNKYNGVWKKSCKKVDFFNQKLDSIYEYTDNYIYNIEFSELKNEIKKRSHQCVYGNIIGAPLDFKTRYDLLDSVKAKLLRQKEKLIKNNR